MSHPLATVRHSLSHVMAEAVVKLYPGTKVAIGPSIDDGFYYDFQLPQPIQPDDFPTIEKEMRRIISSGAKFERKEISKDEAKALFANEPFKLELIEGLSDGSISTYEQDGFVDLCRGPHVESTKDLRPDCFKLRALAGAYWRGDERRPMLTRIYAYAFSTKDELKAHLKMIEEAEKRDHRKVGRALNLFHLDDENPGQVFWHHKGWTIYREIESYVRAKISAAGYIEVKTPSVMPKSLWERSGHWAKYKECMFVTESEKREFALKPMNCPGHIEIFKQGIKSYRDLPLRMAEFGSCCRNEASGALHGIMRVRGFVQDDAHIFCTEEQIPSEVASFCDLLKGMYRDFGFTEDKILVKFSTRPEKRVGDDATWDRAEAALANACKAANLTYKVAPGEGAFYGPKLEFTLVDMLGREWQCGTIQVDYQLPSKERLDANYVGEDSAKHSPVMLHRAILGSLERFIGILIEHFAGAFPVWLSPEQVAVIPVSDSFNEYAKVVAENLKAKGVRVQLMLSNDRMNAKIRDAQTSKIPYMCVVGQKEMESNTVSVRLRDGRQMQAMPCSEFFDYVSQRIASHALDI